MASLTDARIAEIRGRCAEYAAILDVPTERFDAKVGISCAVHFANYVIVHFPDALETIDQLKRDLARVTQERDAAREDLGKIRGAISAFETGLDREMEKPSSYTRGVRIATLLNELLDAARGK